MLIKRVEEMEGRPVEMEGAEGITLRMMVGREDGAPNFSLRHFTLSPEGHSPLHQHNYEHQNYVISGEGTVQCGDQIHPIRPGDYLYVPPGALHQFVNTGSQPLTFLCLVPTSFDAGEGRREATPGS